MSTDFRTFTEKVLPVIMSTSTAPSSASSDADSLNHDENPIKAVIFDYGEVMWMQSRNVHVYRSQFLNKS